jgi:hypothetical protein
MTTLLIKLDDIQHYTTIQGSVDSKNVNPHINNAQILFIEPILGTNLFNNIQNMISGNTIKDNFNYYKLWDEFIKPALVFHTMQLLIPLSAFVIADGGTFQYETTNSQTSTIEYIEKLVAKYKVIGSKYDDKLQNYLIENSELFPEYINNNGLVKITEKVPGIDWYLGASQNNLRYQ